MKTKKERKLESKKTKAPKPLKHSELKAPKDFAIKPFRLAKGKRGSSIGPAKKSSPDPSCAPRRGGGPRKAENAQISKNLTALEKKALGAKKVPLKVASKIEEGPKAKGGTPFCQQEGLCHLDTKSPYSIVKYLMVQKAMKSVTFKEIKRLYKGEASLKSIEDLLVEKGLCLLPDGTFVLDSRFYAGDIIFKYELFKKQAELEKNPRIKAKYLEQVVGLRSILPRKDSFGIFYGMRQKWIPIKYLKEFLKTQEFNLVVRENNTIDIDYTWDGFSKNLSNYLNGKSITGGASTKWAHHKRIGALESAFNEYLHVHPDNLELAVLYNYHFNSHLPAQYEDSALDIDELTSGELILHPYQRSEVRRLLAEENGICSFGVGLGKTLIALALYAWGTKHGYFKRTCIVVPASVLEVWDTECRRFFTPEFYQREIKVIGLNEKRGGYNAHLAKDHLQSALKSSHSLVIMTKEKFCSLRLKLHNRQDFVNYASPFCPSMYKSFEKFLNCAHVEREDYPFFEDFHFDNLVVDEAHVFKNSLSTNAKAHIAYLSTPAISFSALNAIAKAHYLRKKMGGRGTYALTATPVTNSPFEIFNMLSLVTDLSVFSAMGVNTIDDIINVFGRVEHVAVAKVSGQAQISEALMGFVNLDGLRTLFNRFVHFQNDDFREDSFNCPEKTEIHELVKLTDAQEKLYRRLRNDALAMEQKFRNSKSALSSIFSIIRSMDRLTVDTDSYHRKTTFIFEEKDESAVKKLPKLLPSKWIISYISKVSGERIEELKPIIYNFCRDGSGRLSLSVPEDMDAIVINALKSLRIPEERVHHQLNPKYIRLLELMRKYLALGGKQLVFTEEKKQHAKLRRIIAQNLNLPLDCVGIINADESKGNKLFNTIDEYNKGKMMVIIANRKAELGVNLQCGTIAIHHLTLPWTPASVHQRNGRGIRQGNLASEVRVHYYFGEQTFDKYRHAILEAKSNWIGELLTGEQITLDNNEAPTIEEMLELLSDNPQELERKRSERQEAARILYLTKQREGLFNVLRTMTVAHARLKNKEKKDEKDLELKSKNSEHIILLSDLKARLEKMRATTETKVKKFVEEIAILTRKILNLELSPKEQRELTAELAKLKIDKGKVETEHIQESSVLKERIKYLEDLTSESREFNSSSEESAQQDTKYIQQNLGYLMEMEKEGTLPFDIEILKRLGQFMVTEDFKIIFEGDLFTRTEAKERYLMKVTKVFPISRSIHYELLSPEVEKDRLSKNPKGKKGEKSTLGFFPEVLKEKDLKDWTPITQEEIDATNTIYYGDLVKISGDFETFTRKASKLKFDLSRGIVAQKDGRRIILWDSSTGLEEGAKPVFPEPKDAEFRYEICQAWLKAKEENPHLSDALMEDLFGENFQVLAYSYSEVPSLNILETKGQ